MLCPFCCTTPKPRPHLLQRLLDNAGCPLSHVATLAAQTANHTAPTSFTANIVPLSTSSFVEIASIGAQQRESATSSLVTCSYIAGGYSSNEHIKQFKKLSPLCIRPGAVDATEPIGLCIVWRAFQSTLPTRSSRRHLIEVNTTRIASPATCRITCAQRSSVLRRRRELPEVKNHLRTQCHFAASNVQRSC